jgi:hypothetical protein
MKQNPFAEIKTEEDLLKQAHQFGMHHNALPLGDDETNILMNYDAIRYRKDTSLPEEEVISRFNIWANRGGCPYDRGDAPKRALTFPERKTAWRPLEREVSWEEVFDIYYAIWEEHAPTPEELKKQEDKEKKEKAQRAIKIGKAQAAVKKAERQLLVAERQYDKAQEAESVAEDKMNEAQNVLDDAQYALDKLEDEE